jgi:hypothetical protein
MNTKLRATFTGLAVLGATVAGLAATAAPASAQAIKSTGTVTRGESNKIHRGVDKQACLTIKEVQKIVGTKGKYTNYGDGNTERDFKGKKGTSVQNVYVYFQDGCAYQVDTDLTRDRWQSTYNDANAPYYYGD